MLVQGVPEYDVLYRILDRGDMNIVAMVDALTLALSHCELTVEAEEVECFGGDHITLIEPRDPQAIAQDLILQLSVAGYRIVESENQK